MNCNLPKSFEAKLDIILKQVSYHLYNHLSICMLGNFACFVFFKISIFKILSLLFSSGIDQA